MAAVILITVYIWREGWPVLAKVGPLKFLLGQSWQPTAGVFGALPQMIGSIYVTVGALIARRAAWGGRRAVPGGIRARQDGGDSAPGHLPPGRRSLRWSTASSACGSSCPCCRDPRVALGLSLLAGAIVLAVMILPTIISISEDAIRAVPRDYKEASLGLGATHWQTSWRVLLPAARSGILAAVILGAGRAIGETMAVMMVTGNMFQVPPSILQPGATLTGTIALESVYAAPGASCGPSSPWGLSCSSSS